MANNIRKYLEYLFFILVNICLLAPIYGFILLCFSGFAYFITSDIFHVSEDIIIRDDPIFFLFCMAFIFSLIILKFIVLQTIYFFNKNFSYINPFFDKLRTEKNFLFLILFIAFFIDFTCFILTKNVFTVLLGLLFNYLTFIIFFHPYKKNNSEIEPKDEISKILVLSILCISVFIFISPFLLFFIFFILDFFAKIFGII